MGSTKATYMLYRGTKTMDQIPPLAHKWEVPIDKIVYDKPTVTL